MNTKRIGRPARSGWRTAVERARGWLWRDWAKPLLIVVLVTCSLRSSLADWNDVPTGSMKPTIQEGERILVSKLAYDLKVPFTTWRIAAWAEPRRGEVVVLFSPADGKRLVKRVIGIPGDTLELRNNQLWLNGAPVPYAAPPPGSFARAADRVLHPIAVEQLEQHPHWVRFIPERQALRSFGPVHVPADHYFVMGDNRDDSFDSRYFGWVPRTQIVGRATAVVLSFDPAARYRPRWHRFFTALR